jgi:competence ComEA-like helix-hairpin-helix protein
MFNINTATIEELVQVVHIGIARANQIISRREEQRFKDIYELSSMRGFGKSRLDDILNEGKLTCE